MGECTLQETVLVTLLEIKTDVATIKTEQKNCQNHLATKLSTLSLNVTDLDTFKDGVNATLKTIKWLGGTIVSLCIVVASVITALNLLGVLE